MSQILGWVSRQNIFSAGYSRGRLGKLGDGAWFLGCLDNIVWKLGSYHTARKFGALALSCPDMLYYFEQVTSWPLSFFNALCIL